MKQRILAIMLILPLLVALVTMGFTELISIYVPQIPEDIKIEYDQNEAFEFNNFNDTMELKGYAIPETSGASIVWTSSNENIAKIEGNILTFVDEGTVTITASIEDIHLSKSFTATLVMFGDIPKFIKVNHKYPSENGENVVGLYDYSNSLNSEKTIAHTEVINISVLPSMSPQDVTVSGIPENEYKVEDSQIFLTPSEAGSYNIKIQSKTEPSVVSELSFEVTDSVNIYSYEDLVRATDLSDGTAVSLRVNLESQSNLGRSNSMPMGYASGKAHEYVTFESTYDTKFLVNSKKSTELKAAIVFKDDVYGNGHTLNLHDFAYPSEIYAGTGLAIPGANDVFAGEPLEFVSALGLTVFGQGNAGFMVQGDGITVDNIVLKNCNNVDNLSNLDYVGTVLEVVGDNITLKNSTVQNGRTVVRNFSNENLLIDNCLLAYAREFIYKQGSNQFVYPSQGETRKAWAQAKKDLFTMANLPEEAIKGDSTATIRDTDFYTSGIFCIGMDTHFAGELLYEFGTTIDDIAATSYRSTLNLEGDINFYDWKIAKNLDSSTLVKGAYEGIELNMYNLLKNYDKEYGKGTVIKTVKGVEYVHGGIAFFGGGYNISEIYLNGERVKSFAEDNYDGLNNDTYISLRVALNDGKIFGDIEKMVLPRAAGEGYFSFCIYRSSYNGIGVDDTPF